MVLHILYKIFFFFSWYILKYKNVTVWYFLPNFYGKIYSYDVMQEITYRSHIHTAHFPLQRKLTSNNTLIEAQYCFSSVEKGAEFLHFLFQKIKFPVYYETGKEVLCSLWFFWSFSRSCCLKYVFYSANDVFLSHRILCSVLHILKLYYSPHTVISFTVTSSNVQQVTLCQKAPDFCSL